MSKEMTAARLIAAARLAKTILPPIPAPCRPATPDDGYSVQEVLHGMFSDSTNQRRIGYKIGCTTKAMQENLGIDHPCAGSVSDTNVYREHADLDLSEYNQVGVECEIGIVLARDLAPDDAPYDRSGIIDYVSSVMAAIEIVNNRYQDGPAIGVPTLIADDFFGAGAVLGTQTHDWKNIDLAALSGRIYIDGVEKDSGTGAAVMGNPLEAVVWFANMKAARGEILKAGEFILTGSLTVVQWIDAPCKVTAEIDTLGTVSATFS
jgi:2-keto-4-pentenoate hydratase